MADLNGLIGTNDPEFFIRVATPDDSETVVTFMRKLGVYQKMRDAITATPEKIRRLLKEGRGEAVFGIYQEKIVGMMYFYENSSAFIGESGMYLDAFYVEENLRGRGFGTIMMDYFAKKAWERGHRRLEWGCLDWNQSALQFYHRLGADKMDIMHIYRLGGQKMQQAAENFCHKKSDEK